MMQPKLRSWSFITYKILKFIYRTRIVGLNRYKWLWLKIKRTSITFWRIESNLNSINLYSFSLSGVQNIFKFVNSTFTHVSDYNSSNWKITAKSTPPCNSLQSWLESQLTSISVQDSKISVFLKVLWLQITVWLKP